MPIASGAGGKPKQFGIKPLPPRQPSGRSPVANRTTQLRRDNAASSAARSSVPASDGNAAPMFQDTQPPPAAASGSPAPQVASPTSRSRQTPQSFRQHGSRGQSAERMISAPPRVEERRHLKVQSLYGSRPPWATDFDNQNDGEDDYQDDGSSAAYEDTARLRRTRSESRLHLASAPSPPPMASQNREQMHHHQQHQQQPPLSHNRQHRCVGTSDDWDENNWLFGSSNDYNDRRRPQQNPQNSLAKRLVDTASSPIRVTPVAFEVPINAQQANNSHMPRSPLEQQRPFDRTDRHQPSPYQQQPELLQTQNQPHYQPHQPPSSPPAQIRLVPRRPATIMKSGHRRRSSSNRRRPIEDEGNGFRSRSPSPVQLPTQAPAQRISRKDSDDRHPSRTNTSGYHSSSASSPQRHAPMAFSIAPPSAQTQPDGAERPRESNKPVEPKEEVLMPQKSTNARYTAAAAVEDALKRLEESRGTDRQRPSQHQQRPKRWEDADTGHSTERQPQSRSREPEQNRYSNPNQWQPQNASHEPVANRYSYPEQVRHSYPNQQGQPNHCQEPEQHWNSYPDQQQQQPSRRHDPDQNWSSYPSRQEHPMRRDNPAMSRNSHPEHYEEPGYNSRQSHPSQRQQMNPSPVPEQSQHYKPSYQQQPQLMPKNDKSTQTFAWRRSPSPELSLSSRTPSEESIATSLPASPTGEEVANAILRALPHENATRPPPAQPPPPLQQITQPPQKPAASNGVAKQPPVNNHIQPHPETINSDKQQPLDQRPDKDTTDNSEAFWYAEDSRPRHLTYAYNPAPLESNPIRTGKVRALAQQFNKSLPPQTPPQLSQAQTRPKRQQQQQQQPPEQQPQYQQQQLFEPPEKDQPHQSFQPKSQPQSQQRSVPPPKQNHPVSQEPSTRQQLKPVPQQQPPHPPPPSQSQAHREAAALADSKTFYFGDKSVLNRSDYQNRPNLEIIGGPTV